MVVKSSPRDTEQITAKDSRFTAEPCVLVIFGITGNLAQRKLIPAIYNLYRDNMLPRGFAVVGIGRRVGDEAEFKEEVYESIRQFSRKVNLEICHNLLQFFYYQRFDFDDAAGFEQLERLLAQIDFNHDTAGNRIFYLAVAPDFFVPIVEKLYAYRMTENIHEGFSRLIVEKPFGRDLPTAKKLNRAILKAFGNKNIYRLDHFLGKEMLQNMMIIRFANSLFEPLWNNKYIDNVQISVSDTDGIGARGKYYERAGALRDMVQNHLLQLLALVTMEPPVSLEAKDIKNEKVKILQLIQDQSIEFIAANVVRGQYGAGNMDGESVAGYRSELHVAPDSNTETFMAMKMHINNFRWAGVPFYLRTGKRLPYKSAEIVMEFKSQPGVLYFDRYDLLMPNILVFRIQPQEGIFLQFNAKKVASKCEIVPVQMDYCQNCAYPENSPEAYERLLHDVMCGDATLFTGWDEIEYAWSFADKIATAWETGDLDFPNYAAGTWGPPQAEELLARDGRKWWAI